MERSGCNAMCDVPTSHFCPRGRPFWGLHEKSPELCKTRHGRPDLRVYSRGILLVHHSM